VQTKDEDHRVGRPERVLVVRPVATSGDASYALSNALSDASLAELVRVKSERHRIEEMFQEAKGQVGLARRLSKDYEKLTITSEAMITIIHMMVR
jgi:hypothetical protein